LKSFSLNFKGLKETDQCVDLNVRWLVDRPDWSALFCKGMSRIFSRNIFFYYYLSYYDFLLYKRTR